MGYLVFMLGVNDMVDILIKYSVHYMLLLQMCIAERMFINAKGWKGCIKK